MTPALASLYFSGRLKGTVHLTGVQQAVLLAIGLQRKVLEDIEKELGIAVNQLLPLFVKIIRRFSSHFRDIIESKVKESMPVVTNENSDAHHEELDTGNINGESATVPLAVFQPPLKPLAEELREGAKEFDKELKEKQRALIDALPLDRYEIGESAPDWAEAENQVQRSLSKKGKNGGVVDGHAPTVSVKTKKKMEKRKGDVTAEELRLEEDAKHEAATRGKKSKKGKSR